MKKNVVLIGIFLFFLISSVIFLLSSGKPSNPPSNSPTPSINSPTNTTQVNPTLTVGTVNQVQIYLVAIDDQGKSGEKIGCGDSVIPVKRNIAATTTPLRAALEQLLGLKDPYFGQSGLYHALYQSNLSIEKAVITNGTAEVRLSGTMQLGGICDNPRVAAQLTNTVLQFPTVSKAAIYINNKPLEEALSEK